MARDPHDTSHPVTRVLLVEEDPKTRDLRAGILRRAGFSVTEAPTIEDPDHVQPADLILIEAQQLPLALAGHPEAAIVVIADEVRDGILACVQGASDWVPRSTAAEYLISTVEAASRSRT
jgi:DNA-binding response OmpR family regulator